jgi:hypothetical protein
MDIKELGQEDVDIIRMAQDRDRWRALVSTATNIRFP